MHNQIEHRKSIICAALDGAEIEVRDDTGAWTSLGTLGDFVLFDFARFEYRVKPKAIRVSYRRYLFRMPNKQVIVCCDSESRNPSVDQLPGFIRWIDAHPITEQFAL